MIMKEAVHKKATENPKRSPDIRGLNRTLRSNSVAGQMAVLQRSIGNRGVGKLFRSGLLQAKLRIGQPNDIYEQEADRVADQVMRMSDSAFSVKPSAISRVGNSIQMKPG
jgi:hypothetical protein